MRTRVDGKGRRTVAGTISDGTNLVVANADGGWTITRTAAGDYTVRFTPRFLAAPVVAVTLNAGGIAFVSALSVTAESCRIFIYGTGGVPQDQAFHFTAYGRQSEL